MIKPITIAQFSGKVGFRGLLLSLFLGNITSLDISKNGQKCSTRNVPTAMKQTYLECPASGLHVQSLDTGQQY